MTKKIKIFCLPFAGGNKYSYRQYSEKASSFLQLISFDYPGRGSRINEPLIEDMDMLVEDAYQQVRYNIDQTDYAVYGHSLGGLVAYLLTRKLIENNYKAPLHLFITGTTGPAACSRAEKKMHLLAKKEFLDKVKEYGGMSEEMLQNEEWLYYFEPILRADFKASENFIYENPAPLSVPITVITGSEEEMERSDVELWQKETRCAVEFKQLPGNHFFIFNYPLAIVDIFYKKLFAHANAYQS